VRAIADVNVDEDTDLRLWAAEVLQPALQAMDNQEAAGEALLTFTAADPARKAAVVAANGIPLHITLLREGRCVKWAAKTFSCLAEITEYGHLMLDAGV
jgi:hypothetical protein